MNSWSHLSRASVLALALLATPMLMAQSLAATAPENLPEASKVETATEIVADRNLRPMLTTESAQQLRDIAERYRTVIADGGFPKVPRGSYKKGSTGPGVVALNRRLFLDGLVRVEATQGEFASIFTSATEDGVSRYQRNMGLAVTGKVDQTTLTLLNVSAETRLQTILANIDRLEVYGKDLGNRYLVVNIPGQHIETVSEGRVYSRHNAIVGRPSRPSPVVMTALTDINFNPYWNAPVSIVEADIMPKLRSGTKVLDDMNIRVFQGFGGPEVDASRINWSRAVPDDYHFRQEPGPGNAMATAKVNFNSLFGVYLHDTPEKQLFDSKTRFYSSGCVRVQDMPALVNWILDGQDGIGEPQIATLSETLERVDVKLVEPPQLRQVYLTAWPVGNSVAFRHDIYKLDGSGFTVGQPMPVGELSPDGKRFVLKPLPRLVQSIEDGNNNGFFLFGNRKRGTSFFGSTVSEKDGKRTTFGKPFKRRSIAGGNDDDVFATLYGSSDDEASAPASTSDKKKAIVKGKSKTALSSTSNKSKAKKKSDETLGVFDWAKWRKEQAALAKKGKKTAKKKADEKKVAKSPVKKTDGKSKSTEKATASKTANCKPDKNGKLPNGCKSADASKKLAVKPEKETAAN